MISITIVLSTQKGVYHFGEFQLNLDLRVLVRQGQRVPLGQKAYGILTCLVVHAGKNVSKADLLSEVWADAYVEEGTLAQHIFSLRKALGDKANCIVTVPGYGYRFVDEVHHAPHEAVREGPSTASEDRLLEVRERTHFVIEEPATQPQARTKSLTVSVRNLALGAAATVILAGGVAGWLIHARRTAVQDDLGVVVADFTNSTGDSTFDRTLKRALEIDLGQSPYMNVMSDMEGVATLGLMGQKPDTPLTRPVALEICERTNRQVLLTGTISSVGNEYLLTLEATDCHTGKTMAAAKATAAGKDKVLGALDSIAEKGRSKLGESAKSLKSFEVPIADGATPSLEALKAYSAGVYLLNQGKIGKEAAPFFLRAVTLDPNFAQAYGELAAAYYNMGEPQLSGEYTRKLCTLHAHVGARTQFAIDSHCEKNIFSSIKIYQMWSVQYPHDWIPWMDLANLYNDLGQPETALPAAQRASLESGGNEITYDVLIRAWFNAGRFAEAKAAEAEAEKRGKDSSGTHRWIYGIASFEHNAGDLAREAQWYESHKAELRFYNAAEAAAMDGRYKQAEELFGKELEEDRMQQETELANSVLIDKAAMEREVGNLKTAKATLAQVSKQPSIDPGLALERALEGDVAFAEHFLAMQADPATAVVDPEFMPYKTVPLLHAAEAMARKKPLEAIADLDAVRLMELDGYSAPTQRGAAYLLAGQGKPAEAQFQEILAHPGRGITVEYPLAHLGLARAYALDGDVVDSRKEYEAFLNVWKDADPDLPSVMAAKAELARLH